MSRKLWCVSMCVCACFPPLSISKADKVEMKFSTTSVSSKITLRLAKKGDPKFAVNSNNEEKNWLIYMSQRVV